MYDIDYNIQLIEFEWPMYASVNKPFIGSDNDLFENVFYKKSATKTPLFYLLCVLWVKWTY